MPELRYLSCERAVVLIHRFPAFLVTRALRRSLGVQCELDSFGVGQIGLCE